MKKKFLLILAAVLLLSAPTLPALAAKKPGDVWTVDIPFKSDRPLSLIVAEYDISDGLSFENAYGTTRMIVLEKNSLNFLAASVGSVTEGSVMLELKIKDNATKIETVDITKIQGVWEDDVVTIGLPLVRVVIVDLPVSGEAPEAEIIPEPTVYPNNTMCIMGPRLRDLAPESTDKWYMVTPVDLSQEGEQTFPLVASNIYRVGTATVAVKEEQLTVTYKTLKGVTVHSEYLAIYPDLEAAIAQNAADLGGVSLKPGEPISIADTLGGDTSVLLLMCNRVTYDTDVDGLSVFRPGANDVKDTLEQMEQMIK
jgi:hypothetical protein